MAKIKQYAQLVAMFVLGSLFSTVITVQLVHAQTTSNMIYACVNSSSGELRIVDANTTCRTNETPLSWNQQGIQGPPGPSSSYGLPYICYNCYLTPYADKFKGKDYSYAQIYDVEFSGADIAGVIFAHGHLENVIFQNDNLSGADLSYLEDEPPSGVLNSYGPNGWGVSMMGANLTNANLSNSPFSFANFKGANFQNANLSNGSFKHDDFTGALNMVSATLTGATWSNVTCPDGTNSDNDGQTCVGHLNP